MKLINMINKRKNLSQGHNSDESSGLYNYTDIVCCYYLLLEVANEINSLFSINWCNVIIMLHFACAYLIVECTVSMNAES